MARLARGTCHRLALIAHEKGLRNARKPWYCHTRKGLLHHRAHWAEGIHDLFQLLCLLIVHAPLLFERVWLRFWRRLLYKRLQPFVHLLIVCGFYKRDQIR